MLDILLRYRRYIVRGAWAELRYRYAGTGAGIFWNLGNPLLQVAVYVAVFPFLRHGGIGQYLLYLLAGLFPWQAFSEAVVRGSQSLSHNAGLLRSLPVAGEAFVAQTGLTSLVTLQITLLLLLPVAWFGGSPPSWSWLWLPILATLLQALAFGLSLSLAHLRVLFPDIGEALRFLMQLWMWSMPIVYPESMARQGGLGPFLDWNPPYVFLKAIRAALVDGAGVDASALAVMCAWVAVFLATGGLVTRRLHRDVRDWL